MLHALRSVLAVIGCTLSGAIPLLWFTRSPLWSAQTLLTLLALGATSTVLVICVRRSELRGRPPLSMLCKPGEIVFRSRFLTDCRAGWSLISRIEVRGVRRGVWLSRVAFVPPPAPPGQAPAWTGIAEFRMVFRGSKRDAATLRSVLRRRSQRPIQRRPNWRVHLRGRAISPAAPGESEAR